MFELVGLSIQEKKFKTDFQDGDSGDQIVFQNETNLALFDLQLFLILPTKFKVSWDFC